MSIGNTQTAVAKTVLDKVFTPDYIAGSTRQIPKHVSIDRIVTAFRAAAMAKPDVLDCTPTSIRLCFIKSVQSGLIPDGRQAHLIVRRNKGVKELTLQYDWKGVADLVRRSGEVRSIHADVVYENDFFSYEYGTDEHLRHRPATRIDERGRATEVYSLVTLKDGTKEFMVLSAAEVNDIRDKFSQGYRYAVEEKKDNPWISSWGEMAKKTAFLRHSKSLPLSADLREALDHDSDLSQRNRVEVIEPKRQELQMGSIPVQSAADENEDAPSNNALESKQDAPPPPSEPKPASTPPSAPAKSAKPKSAPAPGILSKEQLIEQIQARIAQEGIDEQDVWMWFVQDGQIQPDVTRWPELGITTLETIDARLRGAIEAVKAGIA